MPEDTDTYLHRVARAVILVLMVLQLHSSLNEVQKRFKVDITDDIDLSSYFEGC